MFQWLSNWRARRARTIAAQDAALDRQFAFMKRTGMCTYCYGQGNSDDPPWGIVPCSECGGTGKTS
jgi:hypothetical protein